ncbi:hypothetical protein ACEZCY_32475 [Streptacidiphilus sp. N1-12]|uniref:Lipoprotein n=2 Tax=Streptacidiphilus alkalitolerans TaxID=3342712 RepID=A0ABV6VJF9_9ACTN
MALIALTASACGGAGSQDADCGATTQVCGSAAPAVPGGGANGGGAKGAATSGDGASGGPTPSRTPPSPPDLATCHTASDCGFPDADSTGPRIGLKPHRTGALTITKDGTVIRGWDITGSLDIYADNVTVIDSKVTSTNWWGINLRAGFHGLRVLYSTITGVPGKGQDNGGEDYAVSNMGGSSVEVGFCDISVFSDALSMGQGNLHDNYVHGIVPFVDQAGEWAHTDAVISDGAGSDKLVIRHNTLLNPASVPRGGTAAIGLYADTGAVLNTVVDDNWLAGGAYALYGGGDGANGIQVTNNVFSTEYYPGSGLYGPVAHWNTKGAGNVWRGNRMSDGKPVNPPAKP